MEEKKSFTIIFNGFYIKSLGKTQERIEQELGYKVEAYFIRSYSEPEIQFKSKGYEPPDEHKKRIAEILAEEVVEGLLVEE